MGNSTKEGLHREVTNYNWLRGGLIAVLVGLGLLVTSTRIEDIPVKSILSELSSIVLATAVLAFFWELRGKRAFFEEIWDRISDKFDQTEKEITESVSEEIRMAMTISDQLQQAGITGCFQDSQAVPYHEMMKSAMQIDIIFTYGNTWRNKNFGPLEKFLKTSGTRLRVIMPDMNNSEVVAELTHRHRADNVTSERMQQYVDEAIHFFTNLKTTANDNGSTIELWLVQRVLKYTAYRVDSTVILSLYSNREGRRPSVPAFQFSSDGWMYNYLREEFDGMTEEVTARKLI